MITVVIICLIILVISLAIDRRLLKNENFKLRVELFMIKACRAISTPMNYAELAKHMIKVEPLKGE